MRTIEIVGTDQMKYDVTTIPAKRNEQLRVRLSVKGDDAQDRHGAQLGVAQARDEHGEVHHRGRPARATDFIAAGNEERGDCCDARSPERGETVDISFKVPGVAGEYPFVCTFPGHFQAGMRGTLAVK